MIAPQHSAYFLVSLTIFFDFVTWPPFCTQHHTSHYKGGQVTKSKKIVRLRKYALCYGTIIIQVMKYLAGQLAYTLKNKVCIVHPWCASLDKLVCTDWCAQHTNLSKLAHHGCAVHTLFFRVYTLNSRLQLASQLLIAGQLVTYSKIYSQLASYLCTLATYIYNSWPQLISKFLVTSIAMQLQSDNCCF